MKPKILPFVLLLATAPALAHAADGDWFARVGVHAVNPTSDNGTLAGGALHASIDTEVQPSLVLGRRLSPHWAVELLAAAPFRHTVQLNGAGALDFKHLPPTLSLQYIFAPDARVQPFVGVGLNYTLTFNEKETGPLTGTRTRVADVRWANIDADVTVDGAAVGEVNVDPLVYGIALGWRF